jgi:hypothetical protein
MFKCCGERASIIFAHWSREFNFFCGFNIYILINENVCWWSLSFGGVTPCRLVQSHQRPERGVSGSVTTGNAWLHDRMLYRHPSTKLKKKKTPWPESESELYRPRDRLLSAKLVPTFADRGCHVVSVTNPYGCILGSIDRSRYFSFQVAPQLYSRGWVDPVPDPLLLRKSGSAGNRTRTSGSVGRNSDD